MNQKQLEQTLIGLADRDPSGVIAGLIYDDNTTECDDNTTECFTCGQPTGFGKGPEPMRYDTGCCSSACWHEFLTGGQL